jgi:hypothetical protein
MRRAGICLLMGSVLVASLLTVAHSQEDMTAVDASVFPQVTRPVAAFNHEAHNEAAGIEECNVCHHVYDDQGNLDPYESSEDQRCADCHDLEDAGRQPGLMKAFHLNCKGCHLQERKGPVMCGECHRR